MRIISKNMMILSVIALFSIGTWVIGAEEKYEGAGEHGAKAVHVLKSEHAAHAEDAVHSARAIAAMKKLKPQESCPIMERKINKKLFVDVAGHRIYMCCKGCEKPIKADPRKAIAALIKRGERPEVRLVVCAKCGEIKGGKKCCAKNAVKCEGCGLIKGSIGCCKDLKPLKKGEDVVICEKCGVQKGMKACCAKDAVKCAKCGLTKGSPGCCKIQTFFSAHDAKACAKCGEEKGSDACCKDAKGVKCAKCSETKGSDACCKDAKAAKCAMCGEVKGSDSCCKDAKKGVKDASAAKA